MKVSFTLSLRRILLSVQNFPRMNARNTHGQNTLLSFLALQIRENPLLFVLMQSGGMEIIMSEVAFSQLISFYEKANDGIIMVRNGMICHANSAMCKMCNMNLNETSVSDVLGSELAESIETAVETQRVFRMNGIDVCGCEMDICAIYVENGYMLVARCESYLNSREMQLRYGLNKIAALAALSKDPISTADMVLDRVLKKMPEDKEEIRKYLAMIRKNCFRALKTAYMLEDESKQLLEMDKNLELRQYDIVSMLRKINDEISKSFGNDAVEIIYDEIPESCLVACNFVKMKKAVYNVIATLLKDCKDKRNIHICVTDNKDIIVDFFGSTECWSEEQIAFYRGDRKGFLVPDVQKYGFDMLYVNDIMQSHNGNVSVDVKDGTNHVALKIPRISTAPHMDEYSMPKEDLFAALVALSDVLLLD